MIRTVAPLVMAAWASASSVASLPCAFCTEHWDGVRPARARACCRYGASNSVYLAEETVSGRMTATLPLPSLARGFNVVMAEKVRFSELSEADGVAEEPELLPLLALVDEELLQAAAARHTASD